MTGSYPHLVCAVLAALTLALGAQPAAAWELALAPSDSAPQLFLAVDKSRQSFFVLEHKSPIKVIRQHPCTTGQADGDKMAEGDLRTPEGVYFIRRNLRGGLNYELYGNQAFTLNFPNPVDRIKDKTGSGIWIHGRGQAITPKETKGCVALNNPDLDGLADRLERGTPILIAEKVRVPEENDPPDGEATAIRRLVELWGEAWERQSPRYFELYDPDRYAKAQGQSFARFVDHKKSIFAREDWIEVMIDNIRILPGPDYYVTAFDQFYRSPSLVSELTKRLYWMKDASGQWRIVGKEYDRTDRDLTAAYLRKTTQELAGWLKLWRTAWLRADPELYATFYEDDASQQGRDGLGAIMDHKAAVWDDNPPTDIDIGTLEVELHPQGLAIRFNQRYASATGYSDYGVKTLVVTPRGDEWRIASEQWTRLERDAGGTG
jgi:murein L,D-transpeptidase YafK